MSAAPNERFEVGDLDPAGVLAAAKTNRVVLLRAQVTELELAYQWAVLHPATEDTGVETPGGPGLGCSMPTRRWAVTAPRRWRRSHRRPWPSRWASHRPRRGA